ncbi:hypothetical protein [Gilvibacter sp.]|uniref:hypothetical protein n=1 Tax=Gilvibacter sp. TaxID=2729997 RepID=UPI003F4A374B
MENQPKFLPEDEDAYEPSQSKPAKPESDKSFLLYFIIAVIVIIIIGQTFG